MVRRSIILAVAGLTCSLTAFAQQTLNIHTTSQGIVSFAFEERPAVTFDEPEVMKVSSDRLTLEFPFSDVEKITFADDATGIASLTVRDGITSVSIYDLSGRIVSRHDAKDGAATLSLTALPPGVYVVKDGRRTYKIRRR